MLKKAVFALALAVFTVQTVGWVECCCILICKHHNDPCNNCKDKPKTEVQPDCCKNKTARNTSKNCSASKKEPPPWEPPPRKRDRGCATA